MRFLKRLLVSIYIFVGVFAVACFIGWCVTGNEPAALIAGVCGATGIESVVGGMMKIREVKADKERAELEAKTYGEMQHNDMPSDMDGESDYK